MPPSVPEGPTTGSVWTALPGPPWTRPSSFTECLGWTSYLHHRRSVANRCGTSTTWRTSTTSVPPLSCAGKQHMCKRRSRFHSPKTPVTASNACIQLGFRGLSTAKVWFYGPQDAQRHKASDRTSVAVQSSGKTALVCAAGRRPARTSSITSSNVAFSIGPPRRHHATRPAVSMTTLVGQPRAL